MRSFFLHRSQYLIITCVTAFYFRVAQKPPPSERLLLIEEVCRMASNHFLQIAGAGFEPAVQPLGCQVPDYFILPNLCRSTYCFKRSGTMKGRNISETIKGRNIDGGSFAHDKEGPGTTPQFLLYTAFQQKNGQLLLKTFNIRLKSHQRYLTHIFLIPSPELIPPSLTAIRFHVMPRHIFRYMILRM